MLQKRNGITYFERVKKIDNEENIKLGNDEKLIIFELRNGKRLAFLLDRFTFADVRQRLLRGLCGVLKIGTSNENRVDLNQVARILVDSKPFEA